MTITLTVDEIRAYEKQCEAWAIERAKALQSLIRTIHDPSSAYETRRAVREDASEQMLLWDKAHPFPKLLPVI